MECRTNELLDLTPFVYDLPRILPPESWTPFVDGIIAALPGATLFNVGSAWLYENLEQLRARFPDLRVVDQQFNDVGHLESNRRLACHVDLTTTAHRRLEQTIASDGREPGSVTTVHLGVEVRPSPSSGRVDAFRARIGVAEADTLALYVGRLSAEKRPEWIVSLAADMPDTRFLVVGDGPLRDTISAGVSRLTNLSWINSLEPAQMPLAYAVADLVLLTSTVEGIPLTVMESLSYGTPVVATAVGGLRELDGQQGLTLVAPDDYAAFRDAARGRIAGGREPISLTVDFSIERMCDEFTLALFPE